MSSKMNALVTKALEALGMLDVPLKYLKADARDEALSRLNHFIFFSQRVAVELEHHVNEQDKTISLRDKTIAQRDKTIAQREQTIRHLTLQLHKMKLDSFTAEEDDDDDDDDKDVDSIAASLSSKLRVEEDADDDDLEFQRLQEGDKKK